MTARPSFHAGCCVIIVGILLAGCMGRESSSVPPSSPTSLPTGPTSAPNNVSVPVNVTLPPPFVAVLVDAKRPGHEPVVAVAPDGAIFVHARGVMNGTAQPDEPGHNWLWRSRDGGRNFTRVGSPEMERDSPSEGTVAVLATGRVLVAYSMATAGSQDPSGFDRTVEIYASDDGGDSWRLLSTKGLASAHRTWLSPGAGQTVDLGVMTYHPTFHWRSLDGGATWSQPDRVHDYNTYNGRMVSSGDKVLWPWMTGVYEQVPGEAVPNQWVLDAHIWDGTAWVPNVVAQVAGRGSVFAGATVDAAGTMYLTWSEWSASGSIVWYASSTDGKAWAVHKIAEGPGLRVTPWVATPSAGRIGIVWYQNDAYSGDPLAATGSWFAEYATVQGANTASPVVNVSRPIAQPILDGPLCLQALSCGDVVRGNEICFTPLPDNLPVGDCSDLDHLRNYDDYIGLDYRNGKAVMAFVTTEGFGLPGWKPGDPGHVLVIHES